jgi:protein dithiol oxidoreductase (disulfide-forming)
MRNALFAGLVLAIVSCAATAENYVAGQHYQSVVPPQATTTPDKVEVVEMFWYGCPHCYEFEPVIAEWLKDKPDYVEFVRVPAVFARNWEVHARAYYAAEQLGVLDEIHKALFDALHVEKRKLFDEDELAAFFVEHGVTEEAFRTAFDSFDVDKKTRRAIALTRSYGISGVPAVIVNGKYRSSAQYAGTFEQLLKLVDFLADKEHAQ